MTKAREPKPVEEPMGIIVSLAQGPEKAPIFSAYVWGPAPEGDTSASKVAA
jgi:hypothetical protein